MPRFSANITFLYRELPLPERFAAAKADGFDAVEMLVTEGVPFSELVAARRNAGIEVAMCNAPMGDFLDGGAGLSAVCGREAEFRSAVDEIYELVQALGCRKVHIGPSRLVDDGSREESMACLVGNLTYAAQLFRDSGTIALIEPINSFEMPNIFLSRVDDAISILDSVGQPNAALQFDVYHVARMEADYLDLLDKYIGRIGHIQFADLPGRGEPGSGDLDFAGLFSRVDALGYEGWMGAEYQPAKATSETLAWLRGAQ